MNDSKDLEKIKEIMWLGIERKRGKYKTRIRWLIIIIKILDFCWPKYWWESALSDPWCDTYLLSYVSV